MSETNGTAPQLADIERQLAEIEAREKLERAKLRLTQLERRRKAEELKTSHWWPRDHNPSGKLLREAFARKRDHHAELLEAKQLGKEIQEGNFLWDWVSGYQDLIDRMRSPDGLLLSAISIASDRRYGACWPFFRTWQDLALLRGASRILFQTSALARGAVSGLVSYIIGDGFKYRIVEKEGCPAGLRLACQEVIDENSKVNDWPALEAECLRRDVRDGEWYLRDFPQDNGLTYTRTFGPEQLIQPADSTLEEWSFGKQNPVGLAHDVQTVLNYSVCYDGDNSRPVIVPAAEVLEHTSNVDRDVKRGIPDLAYDTYDFLKVAGRLIENMAEGSAIQAALTEILQFDGPVTPDQANDFLAQEADYQVTNPWTGNEQNVRQVRPGERVVVPKGMTYVPPPFSQGSTIFIQVEQAVLRAVAVTWNAPEWLTSGDASNNNYASSLTAESPFVKAGTHKQNVHYKPRFTLARWRALRNYCAAKGGIVTLGRKYSWEEVRKYIDIQCEPPSMETRNKADEAQANSVRVQGGWKSRQTVAAEEGLDWEQERANIEEYNETMGGALSPLPLPDDGGQGGGGSPAFEQRVLREDGFTGIDANGHKWVNGKQVKRGDGKGGGSAPAASAGGSGGGNKAKASPRTAAVAKAHAELSAAVHGKLSGAVEKMEAAPEGRQLLAKGAELAARVKTKLKGGVEAALKAVDAESKGGVSLIAAGHVGAGAAHLFSAVFVCVHEEVFENALAEHSFPGAHAVGMVAASLAVKAEQGLLKAVAWTWAKARGVKEGREWFVEAATGQTLTAADRDLLAKLGQLAGAAVKEIFAEAGVRLGDGDIDASAAAKRIEQLLQAGGAAA